MAPVRWNFAVCLITVLITGPWIPIPSAACDDTTESASLEIETVDGQPLAAQVRRLQTALTNIGQPLPSGFQSSLSAAIRNQDSDEIQKLLDQRVVTEVTIADDVSVSLKPGPAPVKLYQNQHRAMLIKIVNRAGVKKPIEVDSPHNGAVYAGTSLFSLKRQQQTDLGNNQNDSNTPNRFLDLSMYRGRPLLKNLSGLAVEYAICLVYCERSGEVEAEVAFDIARQKKEPRFASTIRWKLAVQPAASVRFQIVDPTQSILHPIARIEIRDSAGRLHPLPPKRLAPDLFFQPHIYRRDGELISLSPGVYTVRFCRGPEYRMLEQKLRVRPDTENVWRLELQRWIRPSEFGFLSGDHHIHAAGCSHYTSPTQGISPADMYRQVAGEGLNVGCVLTWGPCFDFQRQYFRPVAMDFNDAETLLKYDIEISGFGSQAMGHVCLLNLKDQTYPQSKGSKTEGWPTWTTPAMRWAKEQGGYTGYAHSASGLSIHPGNATSRILNRLDQDRDGKLSATEASGALLPYDFDRVDRDGDRQVTRLELISAHRKSATELPNLSIPEMNGVGAMEICVSAVEGVCDFISAMDTARIQEWNTWYHLLNCGFPIKVSGETDFPCMSSRRVGKGRVYVQMDSAKQSTPGSIDFPEWCRRLAKGQSYVSDGFAHALEFQVNRTSPGTQDVALAEPGQVRLSAKVAFAPQTPTTVAQGTQRQPVPRSKIGDTVELHHPREDNWVEGGDRMVEIIVNGRVAATRRIPADGKVHPIQLELSIDRSSWVALRQFPQLHTNPVNVLVAGKPIRASRKSALWCADMTQLVWKNRQRTVSLSERPAAQKTFANAIDRLMQIANECKESD